MSYKLMAAGLLGCFLMGIGAGAMMIRYKYGLLDSFTDNYVCTMVAQ